jgi:sugar O-acyltransferase (sialic acid O-acetyltransferase NeuD family)
MILASPGRDAARADYHGIVASRAALRDKSAGMPEIILIGVGLSAKAIITAAQQAGNPIRAIYDDDPSRAGQSLMGVPVAGLIAEAAKAGLPAVLGFDDTHQRKAAAERLNLAWVTVIHPKAFLNPSATVGPGTVILEGVIVQPSVVIGRHAILEANATIAHDCVVEDYVHIGPGVDLAGNVRVAQGASLDVGAVVIPNMRVGQWATVGPRAAVIHDVPDNIRVHGVPAVSDDVDPPSGGGAWSRGETALALWLLVGTVIRGLVCAIRRRALPN